MLKKIEKELSLKGKALFQPLRLAITGRMIGPDIGEQLRLVCIAPSVLSNESMKLFIPLPERIATLKNLL